MSWNPQVALAIFVGITATVEDLARREIPNWIPVAAVAGGVCASAWMDGWGGLGSSLLGTVLGFLVFLVFYLLGGMGGGDIKLMAGLGAILGAGRMLEASLWTAGIGGIFAVLALGWNALLRRGSQPESAHIPYAPAITLGAWLSLVPKG
ncbi:MAG: prepilin peptidase [Acidobacteria bacterium]|nr:prepilin peptidase [Acidobacteriota bacterium]